jgi:hypothetical protein
MYPIPQKKKNDFFPDPIKQDENPLKIKHNYRHFILALILLLLLILSCACNLSPLVATATMEPEKTESNTQPTLTPAAIPSETPLPAATDTPEAPFDGPAEAAPVWIELAGEITAPEAEISGMAWDGDRLILLPQFPDFAAESLGSAVVFGIERSEILAYLANPDHGPLSPEVYTFDLGGLDGTITGYEGFEAITFQGDTFYVTLEATSEIYSTNGYLLQGSIDRAAQSYRVDPTSLRILDAQTGIRNLSDEALVRYGDQILTIYEANGQDFNWNPIAHRFDSSLNPLPSLPFPNVEYRLTDATDADEAGFFWAVNISNIANAYFLPEYDPIGDTYGRGRTHSQYDLVERLLQFQITPQGVILVDAPPIQLDLESGYFMRNWEGLAQLEGKGLLLATDKYPTTLLAFIPFP